MPAASPVERGPPVAGRAGRAALDSHQEAFIHLTYNYFLRSILVALS